MTAIAASSHTSHTALRPLNILRDLPNVADLIELCFGDTIDMDGQRYIQQLRRAGRDNTFLRWATRAVDTVSVPLSGYVWEEAGTIVGNVSLIPFKEGGKQVYMIANVAVHPDFRNRGIARALTEAAMQHVSRRRGDEIWLHVREDNPSAIRLYDHLGFAERARRTTWVAPPERSLQSTGGRPVDISKRLDRDWPQHRDWLRRLYPAELNWYLPVPWRAIQPGFWIALYRFMLNYEVRQWASYQNGQLLAAMVWQSGGGRSDRLWLATAPNSDADGLETLLYYVRRLLAWRRNLVLDYPAGQLVEVLSETGFQARRTLIWMRFVASFGLKNRS